MAFHVYPDPQTTPLSLAAGAASPMMPISVLKSAEATPTMYVRIAVAGGGPAPTVTLQADGGAAQTVPANGTTIAIFNAGNTQEADAMLSGPTNDVYLVRIFFFGTLNTWAIGLKNNDAVAHDFVWVVGDSTAEARQPWIGLPATLSFDLLSGQLQNLTATVKNLGTGDLTLTDAAGTSLGSGFTLVSVPGTLVPGSSGALQIGFTAPAAIGATNATYAPACNDTTIGSHTVKQLALSAVTRQLEVVLLLDGSGSMSSKPDGTNAVSPTDSRWGELTASVDQFLQLLGFFGGGKGRFGVAVFPDITHGGGPGGPSAGAVEPAGPITDGAIADAKSHYQGYHPLGNTPMGFGLGFAMGTTATSYGLFQADAASRQYNQRWLVLMSDGAHNQGPPAPWDFYAAGDASTETPAGKHTYPTFKEKNLRVMAIGYGLEGSGNPYPVDFNLLQTLTDTSFAIDPANPHPGRFWKADPLDVMALRKSFRGAITAGLSLDPTSDPRGLLTHGAAEARHSVLVTPYDSKVAFVVDWRTNDGERVNVELMTPTCELITPATKADGVHYSGEARYKMFTIDETYLRNDKDPAKPRYGTWTLIVSAPGLEQGQSEPYEYEVITESRLKLALRPGRQGYCAGDTIDLYADLTLDGAPVTGAAVTLQLSTPNQSSDNLLARARVARGSMEKAREELSGRDVTELGIKSYALALEGIEFHIDYGTRNYTMTDEAGVGVYHVATNYTQTPGSYDFYVTATGQTAEGVAFRREQRLQLRLGVCPDPIFTIVGIHYQAVLLNDVRKMQANVTITPRDKFGNVVLVDPSYNTNLTVTARGGQFAGPLASGLNGTYTRALIYEPGTVPAIAVQVNGTEIRPERAVVAVEGLRYMEEVLELRLGAEGSPGANRHTDPAAALGDSWNRPEDQFLALGAYGSVTLAARDGAVLSTTATRTVTARGPQTVIVPNGGDEITVFVQPSEEPRRYRLEVLTAGAGPKWVALGEAEGVTQSFSLSEGNVRAATAVRVTDLSGRTRDADGQPIDAPGVGVRAVGVARMDNVTQTNTGGGGCGCLGALLGIGR